MQGSERQIVNSVTASILHRLELAGSSKHHPDDQLLLCLQTIFPHQLESALELCDHRSATLIRSPSDRRVYRCLGSSGTPYLISASGIACSCSEFANSIRKPQPTTWCKHLLALRLSQAMGIVREQSASEQQVAEMISEIDFS